MLSKINKEQISLYHCKINYISSDYISSNHYSLIGVGNCPVQCPYNNLEMFYTALDFRDIQIQVVIFLKHFIENVDDILSEPQNVVHFHVARVPKALWKDK